jgi:hypothetical protein
MRFFFSGPRILGIRPGVSFSASDFKTKEAPRAARTTSGQIEGSFVYVVRGDHNLVKVGVTTNPSARLAHLRTGSPFPISFAFIGCTPGNGYDIERAAHLILDRQRLNGEWFDVVPEMAIAAVNAAAAKLGAPVQSMDLATADLALKLAAAGYGADDIDHHGNIIVPQAKKDRSALWVTMIVVILISIFAFHMLSTLMP